MKYIKTYENRDKSQDFIWVLPTDERFSKSLIQIGCPYDIVLEFTNNNFLREKYQFVMINKHKNEKNEYNWGWNPLRIKDLHIYEKIPQFKGYLLTPEEIENIKIEIDANKYNL